MVIILDDLHWSDGPSLLLLEFIAHQLTETKLMVLGTYRAALSSIASSLDLMGDPSNHECREKIVELAMKLRDRTVLIRACIVTGLSAFTRADLNRAQELWTRAASLLSSKVVDLAKASEFGLVLLEKRVRESLDRISNYGKRKKLPDGLSPR